ncbi:hypothetical protein LTS18_014253, partial [Coniosporium uncinatum]
EDAETATKTQREADAARLAELLPDSYIFGSSVSGSALEGQNTAQPSTLRSHKEYFKLQKQTIEKLRAQGMTDESILLMSERDIDDTSTVLPDDSASAYIIRKEHLQRQLPIDEEEDSDQRVQEHTPVSSNRMQGKGYEDRASMQPAPTKTQMQLAILDPNESSKINQQNTSKCLNQSYDSPGGYDSPPSIPPKSPLRTNRTNIPPTPGNIRRSHAPIFVPMPPATPAAAQLVPRQHHPCRTHSACNPTAATSQSELSGISSNLDNVRFPTREDEEYDARRREVEMEESAVGVTPWDGEVAWKRWRTGSDGRDKEG